MNSTTEPIPFGRSMLREHRHVCEFFSSAMEEYDALLPFICDGINCGQRAFHVLPAQHRENHLKHLRNAGIDVEKTMKSRQLEVALPEDTYLKNRAFQQGGYARPHPGGVERRCSTRIPVDADDRACRNGGGRLEERQ